VYSFPNDLINEAPFSDGLVIPYAAFSGEQQRSLLDALKTAPDTNGDYARLDFKECRFRFRTHVWLGGRYGNGGFLYPASL